MTTLSELRPQERAHWELHLNAVGKDTPSLLAGVEVFLKGGELPAINHPSDIHDCLEQPERRRDLEQWLM